VRCCTFAFPMLCRTSSALCGFRQTLAIIGAVVAEFVAAEQGLGYLIFFSNLVLSRSHRRFAALTLLVALSLGFFRAVTLRQGFLFPWSLSGEQR